MTRMPPKEMLRWEYLTDAKKVAIKEVAAASFEAFVRIFYQLVQGQYFIKNWHHTFECRLAERIYRGELSRCIVNVAPGSTKTDLWSVYWPAWCIIQCIKEGRPSRWLPLSYSDDLVTENASRVKELLESEEFQSLWPVRASADTKGKSDWKFFDEAGNEHRMYGTSIGGQVTGRRGGYMMDGFTGAVILDDPMPPRDAGSARIMLKSNLTVARVVRSRLAHDAIPIVLVQQRIRSGDTTDYLTSNKSPDDYELFKLPALIDREYVDSLDEEMRRSCVSDTGFDYTTGNRVSYWPTKEPTETLFSMESADPEMFSSQYQQAPDEHMVEGVVYKPQVDRIIADGRAVEHLPIEPALETYTLWDLGINDTMVVGIVQFHGKEIRLVAEYGGHDQGMEHYINWLHEFRDRHGVRYKRHVAPHDMRVREVTNGASRYDTARRMGITFTIMKRPQMKRDAIEALRKLTPRMWVDTSRCPTTWKALKTLHREWDPDHEAFKDQLRPKWATNWTDMLEQLGLYFRDFEKDDEQVPQGRGVAGGWMGG